MLMAAGLGTRLRPFSDHVAKPLIPVMGVPCAQFAVDLLVRAGVREIVANIHHLPDATRAGLEEMDLGSARLILSDESGGLLGSGGGLLKALPHMKGEPFFITNADVMCSIDWEALARTHSRLRAQWGVAITLAVMRIPADAEEPYRNLELDPARERLVRLGEKARSGWMYIGCAVVEPELIAGLSEKFPAASSGGAAFEFVPEILMPAIASGRAGVHLFSGDWLDMGSPGSWHSAHLHLIRSLETGSAHGPWRRRIELASRRVAPEIWVSRKAPLRLNASDWSGPCFWEPSSRVDAFELGPRAVLYGDPQGAARSDGIGAFGHWASA